MALFRRVVPTTRLASALGRSYLRPRPSTRHPSHFSCRLLVDVGTQLSRCCSTSAPSDQPATSLEKGEPAAAEPSGKKPRKKYVYNKPRPLPSVSKQQLRQAEAIISELHAMLPPQTCEAIDAQFLEYLLLPVNRLRAITFQFMLHIKAVLGPEAPTVWPWLEAKLSGEVRAVSSPDEGQLARDVAVLQDTRKYARERAGLAEESAEDTEQFARSLALSLQTSLPKHSRNRVYAHLNRFVRIRKTRKVGNITVVVRRCVPLVNEASVAFLSQQLQGYIEGAPLEHVHAAVAAARSDAHASVAEAVVNRQTRREKARSKLAAAIAAVRAEAEAEAAAVAAAEAAGDVDSSSDVARTEATAAAAKAVADGTLSTTAALHSNAYAMMSTAELCARVRQRYLRYLSGTYLVQREMQAEVEAPSQDSDELKEAVNILAWRMVSLLTRAQIKQVDRSLAGFKSNPRASKAQMLYHLTRCCGRHARHIVPLIQDNLSQLRVGAVVAARTQFALTRPDALGNLDHIKFRVAEGDGDADCLGDDVGGIDVSVGAMPTHSDSPLSPGYHLLPSFLNTPQPVSVAQALGLSQGARPMLPMRESEASVAPDRRRRERRAFAAVDATAAAEEAAEEEEEEAADELSAAEGGDGGLPLAGWSEHNRRDDTTEWDPNWDMSSSSSSSDDDSDSDGSDSDSGRGGGDSTASQRQLEREQRQRERDEEELVWPSAAAPSFYSHGVLVSNLPPSISHLALAAAFERCGRVERVQFLTDPTAARRYENYAATPEAAAAAGLLVKGKRSKSQRRTGMPAVREPTSGNSAIVYFSDAQGKSMALHPSLRQFGVTLQRRSCPTSDMDRHTSLNVSNLPYGVTSADLIAALNGHIAASGLRLEDRSPAGAVTTSGSCVLTFNSSEQTQQVFELLSGKCIKDRPLHVGFALPTALPPDVELPSYRPPPPPALRSGMEAPSPSAEDGIIGTASDEEEET